VSDHWVACCLVQPPAAGGVQKRAAATLPCMDYLIPDTSSAMRYKPWRDPAMQRTTAVMTHAVPSAVHCPGKQCSSFEP